MRALRVMIVVIAMSAALAAGPAWAQTPPAGQPPPQTPPAQQPPATPPAGAQPPAPQPPQPFPEGAKIAYVDIQVIASNSSEGKAATTKIQDLQKKKTAELSEKQKALQVLQTKLQQGGTVISDSARGQLEKDIEKQNRELQFLQQDAQAEIQQLQTDLQNEFQTKLQPVIDQLAKEKGLHFVFSIRDSGAIWANLGLDLSAEVVKRFDAAAKTPAKK
jgi:outer membrane protein